MIATLICIRTAFSVVPQNLFILRCCFNHLKALCKTLHKAFRISKGSLEMRPMFHFTERRIEAHVCICFVAYKVYKELERIIKSKKIGMSVEKVLDVAKTITTIRVRMPENGKFYTKTLFLTDKHQAIRPLFNIDADVK